MPAPKKPSEYGGKAGIIQQASDGHEKMTAAESAMVMRSEGIRDAGMDESIPSTDEHRTYVDQRIKERQSRFNGRRAE